MGIAEEEESIRSELKSITELSQEEHNVYLNIAKAYEERLEEKDQELQREVVKRESAELEVEKSRAIIGYLEGRFVPNSNYNDY